MDSRRAGPLILNTTISIRYGCDFICTVPAANVHMDSTDHINTVRIGLTIILIEPAENEYPFSFPVCLFFLLTSGGTAP